MVGRDYLKLFHAQQDLKIWCPSSTDECDFGGELVQDSSDTLTPETKSLASTGFPAVEPDSSPATSSNGFVTISGFDSRTAKRLELKFLDCKVSRSGSKPRKGASPLADEQAPLPRKATAAGSVTPPVQPSAPRKMTTLGKKVVKGGLSVFLSGALDDVAPKAELPLPPPVIPKTEGPAWGGAHLPKESASLRIIQSQQKTEPKLVFNKAVKIGSGSTTTVVDDKSAASSSKQIASIKHVTVAKTASKSHVAAVAEETETVHKRIPLSQFVRTSPIAVSHHRRASSANLENSPPPWAAASSSSAPLLLLLRDIQLEQVA